MPRLSKKAQAEIERQKEEARIRAALHWTEEADGPDVPPPSGWQELSTGYAFYRQACYVEVACSSSVSHAIGRTDKVTTQHPVRLYSTRLRALLALRNAVELDCAKRLAEIDRMIEEAKAE